MIRILEGCLFIFAMYDKLKSWLNQLYAELTALHETPHRVAISFALGVFLGILPFTGVLAAIGLAYAFKLNKPAAILGSALTNTWLGLIVLGFALQVGGGCLGLSEADIRAQWQALMVNFHWQDLISLSFLKILLAIAIGYLVLSVVFAIAGYFIALGVIYWHRRSFS